MTRATRAMRRAVGTEGPGGGATGSQILINQLTLSQPMGSADYVLILLLAPTPLGFLDFPTALDEREEDAFFRQIAASRTQGLR